MVLGPLVIPLLRLFLPSFVFFFFFLLVFLYPWRFETPLFLSALTADCLSSFLFYYIVVSKTKRNAPETVS